jgi:hypothetical protein
MARPDHQPQRKGNRHVSADKKSKCKEGPLVAINTTAISPTRIARQTNK